MAWIKQLFFINLILCICLQSTQFHAFGAFERVDGLEYVVRKIEEPPIDRRIVNKYDLYEIYFENRSNKTFSIPGYSIDLGVNYSNLSEIRSLLKNKSSKKIAVFNLAAGAASIAFGGVTKTAVSTLRSVNSFNNRRNNIKADDDENILAPNKTYIIYPGDGLSLFLFINKSLEQSPATIRFICREEDSGLNYVVINNNFELRELNAKSGKDTNSNNLENDKSDKSVIAAPNTDLYK